MAPSSCWMREVSTPAWSRFFTSDAANRSPPTRPSIVVGAPCRLAATRLVAALAAADELDRLADDGLVPGRQVRCGGDDVQMQGTDDDHSAGHSLAP